MIPSFYDIAWHKVLQTMRAIVSVLFAFTACRTFASSFYQYYTEDGLIFSRYLRLLLLGRRLSIQPLPDSSPPRQNERRLIAVVWPRTLATSCA